MASRPNSAAPSRPGTAGASERGDKEVNVQVLVRCRPQSSDEKAARSPAVVKCNDATREVSVVQQIANKNIDRTYTFDKVFGANSRQSDIFSEAVDPIVTEVLEGFNCTIFAYGQTGTGKTHTMTGDISTGREGNLPEQAGVIPRAVAQIFQTLEAQEAEYNVKCTYLELYNEEITDLLTPIEDPLALKNNDVKKLALMEDGKGGVLVRGLEEEIVKDASEIFSLLERGAGKRHTAETLLNKQSSRSHSVFTITIHIKECTPEGEELIKCGKLNLVDLAGSENISRSGAKDSRAREAGEINKSLLTLGRVITALVDRLGHIPYRDSKLTRLLRDSLGGHTKTCIIATVAPTVNCLEETLSTLDYAHRAKNIRNKPQVNQKLTKTALIKDMSNEIEKLKLDLLATREKNGIYLSATRYDAECEERKQLAARVEAQEALIEEKEREMEEFQTMFEGQRRLYDDLSATHTATCAELSTTQTNLQVTTESLEEARTDVEEKDHLIGVHERNEEKIAGRAHDVSGELEAAARDVMGLFDKVSRKDALESANRQVVDALRAEAAERLAAMEAAVAACMEEQRASGAEVRAKLDAFVARKEAEVAGLGDSLGALHEGVRRATDAAAAAAAAQGDSAAAVLSGMADRQRDFTSEAKAAAEESVSALGAAFDSLSASLSAQRDELASFTEQQKAAADAALGRARDMTRGAQSTLDEMSATVGDARGKAEAQHAENEGTLDKLQAEYDEVAAREQEALLGEISNLLSAFVGKKKALVSSTVSGLKGSLREGQAALGATMGSITAAADAAKATLDGQLAEVASAKDADVAALDARMESGCGVLDAAVAEVSSARESVGKAHKAANGRMEGVSEAMAEEAAAGSADIARAVEGTRESMAAERAAADERHGATAGALAAAHEGDKASAQELSAAAEADDARIGGFAASHSSSLSDLSSRVNVSLSEEYAGYEPTGESPRKRALRVPPRAEIDRMRTPAPEDVISEYRRRKAAREAGEPEEEAGVELEGEGSPAEPLEAEAEQEEAAPPPPAAPVSMIPRLPSREVEVAEPEAEEEKEAVEPQQEEEEPEAPAPAVEKEEKEDEEENKEEGSEEGSEEAQQQEQGGDGPVGKLSDGGPRSPLAPLEGENKSTGRSTRRSTRSSRRLQAQ